MGFIQRAARVAVLFASCFLAGRAVAQPVTWTGAGDGVSWNQAANWSPATVPGPTNAVTIGAGATTINMNVGTTVQSLSLDRTMTIVPCNLLIITGGLNLNTTGLLRTGASFCEGLRFSGTQSVIGSGSIEGNNASIQVTTGSTLTLASGVTLTNIGANSAINLLGTSTLINNGTIRSSGAGGGFTVNGTATATFTNNATMQVESGAGLAITGLGWTNSGTITINGGTLTLGGSYAALGTINRTGGNLNLSGTFIGTSINLNAQTGSANLASFSASAATLNATAGLSYTVTATSTLNGCTLNAALSMSGCQFLNVSGGLTLGAGGSITTGPSFCENLRFVGTQSVGGAGTLIGSNGSIQVVGANATLTLGGSVVVTNQGANGTINIQNSNTLVNNATIRSSGAGGGLTVTGGPNTTFTNNASLQAETGAVLAITATAWSNSGTIAINGGTATLGGIYTALGTVNRTGGTLNLAGTFTGSSINLTAQTGPANIASMTATGSTFNADAGLAYTLTATSTFTGCTLNAPLTTTGCQVLNVTGGLTLGPAGSITTGPSFCEGLRFTGTQTVSGSGTITSNNGSIQVTGTNAVLTLASGITLTNQGANSAINMQGNSTLVNNGTIRATGAGGAFTVTGASTSTFTNTGTLRVDTGASLTISILNWANNGTLLINGGTANLGGSFSALGTINRIGGTINFSSAFSGSTLTVSNATGPINFASGASFTNTTLDAIDGQTFSLSGAATFTNVTLNAPIAITTGCQAITVQGGLVLGPNATITTGNSFCNNISFVGTQTVSGSGSIKLANGTMVVTGSNAILTLAQGITLESIGGSSVGFSPSCSLVNQGTIKASGTGRTLTFSASTNGTLTNGPTGTVEASSAATVVFSSITWSNTGTLLLNGGTMTLGGTCNGLGTVNRTGGTLTLQGAYTPPTLTATTATGTINLSQITFPGTTFNATGTGAFAVASSVALIGATLDAPLPAPSGCQLITVTNGLTIGPAGSITTSTSFCDNIVFSGIQTLTGGTITLDRGVMRVEGTLTLSPSTLIQATSNASRINVTAGSGVINNGTLQANGSNRTLTIFSVGNNPPAQFSNAGLVQAHNAGAINLSINTTNDATFRASSSGQIIIAQGLTTTLGTNSLLNIQGTGPNNSDFGRVTVNGTLVAGGLLTVTYPNGLVPGCRVGVPIVSTTAPGLLSGTFINPVGPPKPLPFASLFIQSPTGILFSSTNQADVGSAGGIAQPDGILNNNDFIVFIDLFFANSPVADRGSTGGTSGADGLFNNNDFIVFIDQFFAGCSV